MTPSTRSLVAALLQGYARFVPYHRGKQRIAERLVARLGVSLTGERVVRRGGLWWSLDPADYVCQDLFWAGAKDVAAMRIVRRIMRPRGVMLDLGASFGYYSIVTAHVLRQQCTVHAFEPGARAFQRLRANLARNAIHCVQAHRAGVWDREGTASVVDDLPEHSAAAYLTPDGDVPVVTIDGFCERHGVHRLDLIKIDVEGSELRVLQGAERTLETLRPVLILELNPLALRRAGTSAREVLDRLREHRYVVHAIERGRRNMPPEELGETVADMLCTPRDAAPLLRPHVGEV